MERHRRTSTAKVIDPICYIRAPKARQRQFACRLCNFVWAPFERGMPKALRASREAHRCWIPDEVIDVCRAMVGALADDALIEVMRDRLEELTGDRGYFAVVLSYGSLEYTARGLPLLSLFSEAS